MQGQAVTAADVQRLQHVFALAQHAVEQRPVAGFIEGFADRAGALDKEGFMARARGQPFAVSQVVGLAVAQLDFLQEQVLIVAHDHGHAPGQFTVEARHHGRYAGNRNPSGLELWRANLYEVPRRGHGQWQVGVVGQQALAAARTLRGNCPVVRGGDAEHVQLGDLAGGAADGAQALDGACAVAAGQV